MECLSSTPTPDFLEDLSGRDELAGKLESSFWTFNLMSDRIRGASRV